MKKDKEELLDEISRLRGSANLNEREIMYLKVCLAKQVPHKPVNSQFNLSNNVQISELNEVERLKDEILAQKRKIKREKEEKDELKIQFNRLRKYIGGMKKNKFGNQATVQTNSKLRATSEKNIKAAERLRFKVRKLETEIEDLKFDREDLQEKLGKASATKV